MERNINKINTYIRTRWEKNYILGVVNAYLSYVGLSFPCLDKGEQCGYIRRGKEDIFSRIFITFVIWLFVVNFVPGTLKAEWYVYMSVITNQAVWSYFRQIVNHLVHNFKAPSVYLSPKPWTSYFDLDFICSWKFWWSSFYKKYKRFFFC